MGESGPASFCAPDVSVDMDCEEARQRLHDRVSGELAGAEEAAFAVHVAACPTCAASLDAWSRLRAGVGARGRAVPMPAGLRERVEAGLERERAMPRPMRRFETVLALAASIAIVVGLGLALFTTRPPRGPLALASLAPIMVQAWADHDVHGNALGPKDDMGAEAQRKMLADYASRWGALSLPPTLGAWRRERCLLCPLGGASFPHVSYVDGARAVSLYVVPASMAPLPARGKLYTRREKDETLLAWDNNGMVYMMISREPEQTLVLLAAAFRADGG